MKKLWDVLVLTLAVNFLLAAGGIGWLYQSGRLDRGKTRAIREMVFAHPGPTTAPTTQPSSDQDPAATQPILRLDELLAREAGRSTEEQMASLRRTFDAQMATIDRRQRELLDLQQQVDLARQQIARDRESLESDRAAFDARQQQAAKLASDKGFQDSLARYQAMSGKQVKQIFMGLDDDTVREYLQAMEPRQAARVIKEFKAPDEIQRIERVLEKMRLAQSGPTTRPGENSSASASASPAAGQ